MTKQTMARILGVVAGIVVGILLLTIGFWKTLLLAALAVAGYFLASDEALLAKISAFIQRFRRTDS